MTQSECEPAPEREMLLEQHFSYLDELFIIYTHFHPDHTKKQFAERYFETLEKWKEKQRNARLGTIFLADLCKVNKSSISRYQTAERYKNHFADLGPLSRWKINKLVHMQREYQKWKTSPEGQAFNTELEKCETMKDCVDLFKQMTGGI